MRLRDESHRKLYEHEHRQGRLAGLADKGPEGAGLFRKGPSREAWKNGWRQGQLERQQGVRR